MYRIGILGTENSHAAAFARLANLKSEDGTFDFPDFRVTALYAHERAPSEQIVAECGEDIVITDTIEEMLPLVDCIMVTARHGRYHLDFARPFIEKGMPAFIDKPFTITESDGRELISLAQKHNALLSGGSGCKYSAEITKLKSELEAGAAGKILSAQLNFPAGMGSEYGGFYFYASHLIEMVTKLFGDEIKAVTAFENSGNLLSVAEYEGFDAVLNFSSVGKYYATIYGDKDVLQREIRLDDIYRREFEVFTEMVRNKIQPYPLSELLTPVLVMNAMEKSLETKGRIALKR